MLQNLDGRVYHSGLNNVVITYPANVSTLQQRKYTSEALRLAAGQPGALSVDWQVINVSREKHTGYAVQWFSMAAVLLLIFLLRSSNLWDWLRGAPHKEMDS